MKKSDMLADLRTPNRPDISSAYKATGGLSDNLPTGTDVYVEL